MTSKENQPATPLPWKDGPVFGSPDLALFWQDASKPGWWQRRVDAKNGLFAPADARYIAHACNAYPRLVEALRKIVDDYAVELVGLEAGEILHDLGEIK